MRISDWSSDCALPISAHVAEELRGYLVLLLLRVDLGLEDLAQLLGIGAVDSQLDALAQERVLHGLGRLLESQQALATGGLSERHDDTDRRLGVDRLAREGTRERLDGGGRVLHRSEEQTFEIP